MKVSAHTDAAFCHKSQISTWAIWVQGGGLVLKHKGICNLDTHQSQYAELYAVIMAIKHAIYLGATEISICTDCLDVVKAVQFIKPEHPLTQKLVEYMGYLTLPEGFKLEIKHVKAHTTGRSVDVTRNRWCDKAATKLRRRLTIGNIK